MDASADFSWTVWNAHSSVIIGLLILGGAYLYGAGPLRERLGLAEYVEPGKVAVFFGGLLVIFLALVGPLHELAENYFFTAHMTQHLLLQLAMPPLLTAGDPSLAVASTVPLAPSRTAGTAPGPPGDGLRPVQRSPGRVASPAPVRPSLEAPQPAHCAALHLHGDGGHRLVAPAKPAAGAAPAAPIRADGLPVRPVRAHGISGRHHHLRRGADLHLLRRGATAVGRSPRCWTNSLAGC